eukprot:629738-Amphidinium_carterae.4
MLVSCKKVSAAVIQGAAGWLMSMRLVTWGAQIFCLAQRQGIVGAFDAYFGGGLVASVTLLQLNSMLRGCPFVTPA